MPCPSGFRPAAGTLAPPAWYDRVPDLALALEQGKIAGFLMDEPIARLLCQENPAVTYLPEVLVEES